MHFALPTSGHDWPCAVPKFTGICAVIVQPANKYIHQVRYIKNIADNNSVAFIFQMYVQFGGIFLKCFDIFKHLRASGKVDKIKKYRRDIPR